MSTSQPLPPGHIYCSSCYKVIRKDAKYCPHCGDYQDYLNKEKSRLRSEKRWEIIKNIIIFYVIYLASVVPLLWLEDDQVPVGVIVISILDAFIVLFYWNISRYSIFSLLHINRQTISYIFMGILVLVPLIFINVVYHGALIRFFGVNAQELKDPFITAGYGFGLIVVFECLMPAVWEEIAFRGLIQGKLNEVIRPTEAIFLTAILFAIIHVDVFSWFYLFLFGVVLGFMRLRSKSLWPCVVSHFLHNLVVLYMEYYGF